MLISDSFQYFVSGNSVEPVGSCDRGVVIIIIIFFFSFNEI